MRLIAAILLLGTLSCVAIKNRGNSLQANSLHSTPLADVKPSGDLARRIELNRERLLGSYYHVDMMEKTSPDWPGDLVGREILALTLLSQSTGSEPPLLNDLLHFVQTHLNAHGYLGPVLPAGIQNEQYLSGHSWLLRGLAEHYRWKHDALSLRLLKSIINGLFLPTRGAYAKYPIDPAHRVQHGEMAGQIKGEAINGWHLSSDIGCAFIALDGVTQAAEIDPSPQIDSLIQEMIARFAETDLARVQAQTHATLSATRGVLRYYSTHPDPKYLALASQTAALYFDTATTEHFANYNWFGRPEWTEACAVVDSLMVCVQLYEITRDPKYLERAQLINYNALAYAERPNGGFGCDVCVGANHQTVLHSSDIFEAPFCCSMRGAEGLTAVGSYAYLTSATNEVVLPLFLNNIATLKLIGGDIRVAETTDYPLGGNVDLEIIESANTKPINFAFFIPAWVGGTAIHLSVNDIAQPVKDDGNLVRLTVIANRGDRIHLSFPVTLRVETASTTTAGDHVQRYFHGPLLLGTTIAADQTPTTQPIADVSKWSLIAPATYRSADGVALSPIDTLTFLPLETAKTIRQQILFSK